MEQIKTLIAGLYIDHNYLLKTIQLEKEEVEIFEKIKGRKAGITEF